MNLFTILAGPIIRKTTTSEVIIWFATKELTQITISLYDDINFTTTPLGFGSSNVVQLGTNFYVHLVTVRANQHEFPINQLIFYSISLNNIPISQDFLNSITYENKKAPSFFIQKDLNNIIYGSCRKPHSKKKIAQHSKDHLSIADTLVKDNFNNLDKRPSSLFLMGDQIYADDVGAPQLVTVAKIGAYLTGSQEVLPNQDNDDINPYPSPTQKLYQRDSLLKDSGSTFTSSSSENHLMTFGEFAAAYLFALGGLSHLNFPSLEESKAITPSDKNNKYKDELSELKNFMLSSLQVRRLFANIPTYMIFDDHEVTDDWNINKQWVENTSNSNIDRRIMANALAACWAFQSWGNDPAAFSNNFISSITSYLHSPTSTQRNHTNFEHTLFNHNNWGFTLNTSPKVMVLDTRTQRDFDSAKSPAKLLGSHALQKVIHDNQDIIGKDLIIISPTPVYGFEPIEFLQKVLVALGFKPSTMDFESWVANREGFAEFMTVLAKDLSLKSVIFISGDVHYSFATKATFKIEDKSLNIHQLTSSPLKNNAVGMNILQKLSGKETHKEHRFGWNPTKQIPRYIRIFRPAFDLLIRLNIFQPNPETAPIWFDTLETIKPTNENILVDVNNIGLLKMYNNKAHTQILYTYTKEGSIKKIIYKL